MAQTGCCCIREYPECTGPKPSFGKYDGICKPVQLQLLYTAKDITYGLSSMYSLLPAFVSGLFLAYGIYVLVAKGFNWITLTFFLHCITTFFWQGTWAVLFQVRDPEVALVLVKFGYLLIVFLPVSLYHFLTEISGRHGERRYVYIQYGLAAMLGGFTVSTSLFVDGYYDYFWGYYPKAGILHPLHLLQTVVAICRGLYITWQEEKLASPDQRIRLRLCIVSILIYYFAAIDYLCNYGFAIYPLGGIFTVVSLGLIFVAITRYDLMRTLTVASTVAHEMRTPLSTISLQANAIAQHLPHLYEGYQLAVDWGLIKPQIDIPMSRLLLNIPSKISHQVDRSNAVIDMMLASARMEHIDTTDFARHSMQTCVAEALETYPFSPAERDKVSLITERDFDFYGSRPLFIFVLFNLLKNSLYAIKAARKGDVCITITTTIKSHALKFTDTACGIPTANLPYIFDTFYSTKKSAGAGIGLAFCQRAVTSFQGQMHCDSVEGEYTTFRISFAPSTPTAQRKTPYLVEQ